MALNTDESWNAYTFLPFQNVFNGYEFIEYDIFPAALLKYLQ